MPLQQNIPERSLPLTRLDFLRAGGLNSQDGEFEGTHHARLAGIVRVVVRSELFRSRSAHAEDIEDVCSDAMVALLGRMEAAQKRPEASPEIDDLDAYVAGIARRACSAWSRRQHPGFHRLRSGLRYLLQSDKRFALWQNTRDEWVCGWALWEHAGSDARQAGTDTARELAGTGTPAQILEKIFTHTGHPMFFNEVSQVCARFWAVDDTPQPLETLELTASGPSSDIDEALYREARLMRVWAEIRELPERQRTALLLNMHGPDGECGTSLLILTGTASPRDVAAAAGIPAEEFAELLTRLPLSDKEIADRMGITRQQVINLRKCARERLRRRMLNE